MTVEREEREPTHVRKFSYVRLQSGGARTIAVLSRPGDAPALAVSRFRDGQLVTRILFHVGLELDVLRAAIAYAENPELPGAVKAGSMPHGTELCVWVRAVEPGVIGVGRVHADGRRLGSVTYLKGDEFVALKLAVSHIRRMTRGRAPLGKGIEKC